MLSTAEAWWAGLCTRPFDGAQGDNPFLDIPWKHLFVLFLVIILK